MKGKRCCPASVRTIHATTAAKVVKSEDAKSVRARTSKKQDDAITTVVVNGKVRGDFSYPGWRSVEIRIGKPTDTTRWCVVQVAHVGGVRLRSGSVRYFRQQDTRLYYSPHSIILRALPVKHLKPKWWKTIWKTSQRWTVNGVEIEWRVILNAKQRLQAYAFKHLFERYPRGSIRQALHDAARLEASRKREAEAAEQLSKQQWYEEEDRTVEEPKSDHPLTVAEEPKLRTSEASLENLRTCKPSAYLRATGFADRYRFLMQAMTVEDVVRKVIWDRSVGLVAPQKAQKRLTRKQREFALLMTSHPDASEAELAALADLSIRQVRRHVKATQRRHGLVMYYGAGRKKKKVSGSRKSSPCAKVA
jgi:hypothetical protein